MARCGCTQSCSCAVTGAISDTIETVVTGTGAPGSPYVVTSELIPESGAESETGCAWGFNGEVGLAVPASDDADIEINAPTGVQAGWLYVTATGPSDLPAGLWTIHGTIDLLFDDPATGDVIASYVPSPADVGVDPLRGGTIYGQIIVTAADQAILSFSGVVLQDAIWTPTLTVVNSTAEAITGTIRYNAFGVACNYATTATTGGG